MNVLPNMVGKTPQFRGAKSLCSKSSWHDKSSSKPADFSACSSHQQSGFSAVGNYMELQPLSVPWQASRPKDAKRCNAAVQWMAFNGTWLQLVSPTQLLEMWLQYQVKKYQQVHHLRFAPNFHWTLSTGRIFFLTWAQHKSSEWQTIPVKLPTSCYLCLGTMTWLKGIQLPHQNRCRRPTHSLVSFKTAWRLEWSYADLWITAIEAPINGVIQSVWPFLSCHPGTHLCAPCLHCGRPSKAIQQLDALRLRGPHDSRLNGEQSHKFSECLTVTNQKHNSTTQGLPNFPAKAACFYFPSKAPSCATSPSSTARPRPQTGPGSGPCWSNGCRWINLAEGLEGKKHTSYVWLSKLIHVAWGVI